MYVTKKMIENATLSFEEMKEKIWHENLDSFTCRKIRKQSLDEWDDMEEAEYQDQIEKCKNLIAGLGPLIPETDEKGQPVVIVSDEEYEIKVEENKNRMEENTDVRSEPES